MFSNELLDVKIDELADDLLVKYGETHPEVYSLPKKEFLAKQQEFRNQAKEKLNKI